jgi:energy-coupling factor transporter ATP-binding protein EcfA2
MSFSRIPADYRISPVSAPRYRLRGVEVANLRGFERTSLEFAEGTTLLVGPNNCGKTSLLRLLNWFLNEAERPTLEGAVPLDEAEAEMLLPARVMGKQARRLTLRIEIADGRTRRRYPMSGDIVDLRMTIAAGARVRLNVGPPRRPEEPGNEWLAGELYDAIQESIAFTLIPAARDAASDAFRRVLRDAAAAKLEDRVLRTQRGRAPAESTKIREAVDQIQGIGASLLEPLWEEMKDGIPAGLARSAALEPEISPRSLIDWLADNTTMSLVTGDHDAHGVSAVEVGSGLQSLLEVAVNRAVEASDEVDWMLAIEEPEAFLHPSAQRTLARLLRSTPGRLLVSTHSPVLVDEARYGEVVLVRDHHFFEPRPALEERRQQINTALLTGHGAEMAFASSLLLVEGEGDRLFFERLRRRLAIDTGDSRIDRLYVLPVGGKTNFAPWLQLLKSYGDLGSRPINWLIVADDDAAKEVRDAYAAASVRLAKPVVRAIADQRAAVARNAPEEERNRHTARVNRAARIARFRLLPGELEGSALAATSKATREALVEALEPGAPIDRDDLVTWLLNNKGPWMRAMVGDRLPWNELSNDVVNVLTRWIRGAVSKPGEAKAMIKDLRQE